MASRRKKPKLLSETSIKQFVEVATRMHDECIRHDISAQSDHYQALANLNQEVCKAIRTITGEDPHWMKTPPHWQHPGYRKPGDA